MPVAGIARAVLWRNPKANRRERDFDRVSEQTTVFCLTATKVVTNDHLPDVDKWFARFFALLRSTTARENCSQ